MWTKHAILVLLAAHELTALSSPAGQVPLQGPAPYLESNQTNNVTSSADPIVFLDSGTFVGVQYGPMHSFMGIPFAYPP